MVEGLGPGDTVLDGAANPTERGTVAPATFRSMSIVAKRRPISATAELLFYQLKNRLLTVCNLVLSF